MIVSPLVYYQEKFENYGVCSETGTLYSRLIRGRIAGKIGEWRPLRVSVSGSSPYPKTRIMRIGGGFKSIVHHVAVHETLNPVLPIPPGIPIDDWNNTPESVKLYFRNIWQVNHKDHRHTNARPDNLEWVTANQNVHAYQKFRVENNL